MKALWRGSLVVAGLVVGLLAAEAAVRLCGLDPVGDPALIADRSWNQDCVQPAIGTGYEYRPGACGANRLGLQDREPPGEPPADQLRVLMLGDSIAADRLYPDMLEDRLAASLRRPVEVLNAGVPGYATTNQLAWYERHGDALEPHLLVLQFCTNDYGFTPFLFRHEGRVLQVEDTSGAMTGRSLLLFERSALYRALVVRGLPGRQEAGAGKPVRFDFDARAPQIDAALLRLADLAAERGDPLLVVVFPPLLPHDQWPEREAAAWLRARALLAEHDVAMLDIDPVFQQGDISELRRAQARQTLDRLDQVVAERDLGRRLPTELRRDAGVQASVAKQPPGAADDDFTHPNFLGHHLAAVATEAVVLERGWGELGR